MTAADAPTIGAVIIVSHESAMLGRVVNRIEKMSVAPAANPPRNEVVAELPVLSDARFVCREPLYVSLLWRIAPALCAAALAGWVLAASALPRPLAALLLGVAGLALVAAMRRRGGAIDFAADCSGIFFAAPSAAAPRWLFVPWANVTAIGVQWLLEESGRKGLALTLRVSAHERRQFFARSVWRDAGPAGDGDALRVAYPGVLGSPYRLAATLRALQSRRRVPAGGEGERLAACGNKTVTTPA